MIALELLQEELDAYDFGDIELCDARVSNLKSAIAELEALQTSKPCDGCINKPLYGDNYDHVCGNCSRFYGDHYTIMEGE